jgi:hypothetical protein
MYKLLGHVSILHTNLNTIINNIISYVITHPLFICMLINTQSDPIPSSDKVQNKTNIQTYLQFLSMITYSCQKTIMPLLESRIPITKLKQIFISEISPYLNIQILTICNIQKYHFDTLWVQIYLIHDHQHNFMSSTSATSIFINCVM